MEDINQSTFSRIPLHANLSGWFAVARSHELQAGCDKTGFLADEHYVLSRMTNGGLALNGKNDYVVEQNNFIFAWHHPNHTAPNWHIPVLSEKGWSLFLHHEFTIMSHPQEIYENCIDLAHFSNVHHYSDMSLKQAPVFEAHSMSVKHQIQRKNPNIFSKKRTEINFEVRLHGIGCAHTHILVPTFGMRVRMFTLTTPIQKGLVHIRLTVAIAMDIKFPLKKLLMPLVHSVIHKCIVNDFRQDILIWENKCYRAHPLLVKGDGQIIKFRHWCRQFYA